jgi:monofunctional biosynthetic peptidoglycan transglycosylase
LTWGIIESKTFEAVVTLIRRKTHLVRIGARSNFDAQVLENAKIVGAPSFPGALVSARHRASVSVVGGTLTGGMGVRIRRAITGLLAVVVFVMAAVAVIVLITWPDVGALESSNPSTSAFIERARQQGADVRWRWVPLARISPEVQKAVVVAEDITFFSHDGFDRDEIAVAVREALRGDRLRGASTITQQLAKNLWLSTSRSPLRKLREIILTRQLERRLTKLRILELYLNVVELGPGLFGVEAAAGHYFDIPSSELDADQAALLAASLPRPKSWHPGVESAGYEGYVEEVLRRMEQADWLDRHLAVPY